MPETRHAVKDSVFTCLFGKMEYALELYRALHPEDPNVTEEDCEIVTLENVRVFNSCPPEKGLAGPINWGLFLSKFMFYYIAIFSNI